MENGYFVLDNGFKVELPAGIHVLDQAVVSPYKESLVEVYVPDSVVIIEDRCFHGANVRKVKFSEGYKSKLKVIGNAAFDGCGELNEFDFPNNLEYIGREAFAQTALTSVDLSETDVRYIGGWAFIDCAKLMKVTLTNSLDAVSEGCFAHCRQLMKVDLADVKVVMKDAFRCCEELEIVEGVSTIMEFVGLGNEAVENYLED